MNNPDLAESQNNVLASMEKQPFSMLCILEKIWRRRIVASIRHWRFLQADSIRLHKVWLSAVRAREDLGMCLIRHENDLNQELKELDRKIAKNIQSYSETLRKPIYDMMQQKLPLKVRNMIYQHISTDDLYPERTTPQKNLDHSAVVPGVYYQCPYWASKPLLQRRHRSRGLGGRLDAYPSRARGKLLQDLLVPG